MKIIISIVLLDRFREFILFLEFLNMIFLVHSKNLSCFEVLFNQYLYLEILRKMQRLKLKKIKIEMKIKDENI